LRGLGKGEESMTTDEMIRSMYGDMQEMKGDIKELKTDVAGLKTDVEGLKTDVEGLKTDVKNLEKKVDENTQRITVLEGKVDENTKKITKLNLVVENSINPAIKIIAENHCELSKKLNMVVKDQVYFNGIEVRLDVLESDVAALKNRIGA
jgi:predicted  nucleic acid-binding Zn-ribbon protein